MTVYLDAIQTRAALVFAGTMAMWTWTDRTCNACKRMLGEQTCATIEELQAHARQVRSDSVKHARKCGDKIMASVDKDFRIPQDKLPPTFPWEDYEKTGWDKVMEALIPEAFAEEKPLDFCTPTTTTEKKKKNKRERAATTTKKRERAATTTKMRKRSKSKR